MLTKYDRSYQSIRTFNFAFTDSDGRYWSVLTIHRIFFSIISQDLAVHLGC